MAKKKQRRHLINFNESLRDPRGEPFTQLDREGKKKNIVIGDIIEGVLSMSSDKPDQGERRKRVGLVERMINRASFSNDKEQPFHELDMRRSDCAYIVDLLEQNPPSENQFIMQRMVDILEGKGPEAFHYHEDDWEDEEEEEDVEGDVPLTEAAGG